MYKWYLKKNQQDVEIERVKSEQCLLTYGMLACLKGLKEQGCNDSVTEAIDKIEKHINKQAHNQGEEGANPIGIFIHNDAESQNANAAFYQEWLQTHNLENGFAHILPFVANLNDFAGIRGRRIANVAISVNKGSVKYRVHVLGKGWLPWVTGCDATGMIPKWSGWLRRMPWCSNG